jgi:two-component system, OmpR family, response regulator
MPVHAGFELQGFARKTLRWSAAVQQRSRCCQICLFPERPESVPLPAHSAQSKPAHLLVVDDDREISKLLVQYFSAQGYEVSAANDGIGMREALARSKIDLIVLDLGLPGEDGLDLTRYLRENWKGPVIILSGRGEPVDRVVGLELGADDYVTKPFNLRELLARVRSVLRRSAELTPAANEPDTVSAYHFSDCIVDPGSRKLINGDGHEIALTTGEYDLLNLFLDHPNLVLSRDMLMNHLYGRDAGPYDRAIDVQVSRLRRKIGNQPECSAPIKAIRGVGYIFTERVRRE